MLFGNSVWGITSSSWGLPQLRGGRESKAEEEEEGAILFQEGNDQMNLYGSARGGKSRGG